MDNLFAVSASILLVGYLLPAPITCNQDEDSSGFNDSSRLGFESIFNSLPIDETSEHSKCLNMNIPFCEGIEYNRTILPNSFGHLTQQDVISEINIYHPLIKNGCSPDLKLFLCTVYAPICFDHVNDTKLLTLMPCRSLCESARRGCLAHFKQFNRDWPDALDCQKFPTKNDGTMCVGKDEETRFSNNVVDSSQRSETSISAITRDLGFVCPKNFEVSSYTFHLNGKTYSNCAMPCDDVLLDRHNTQIVRSMTLILAVICLISTLFTCITFCVNTKRFKYPARPIIFIAFCQLIVATCYIIGFATYNKISCNEPVDPPKSLPNLRMIRYVNAGNKKGSCTLQFMALYFFQISTMFWWLMMTISWYMIAKLKWAPESVSSASRYFHLFSWIIPALLTIYLSVLGDIEGDPLTGTCYVSLSNQESIKAFFIYPTLICVFTGCIFLVSGFKSLWASRETLKREYGKQTDEHYKLVLRIVLFSLIFIVSSIVLMVCHHYEQSNLNTWMLSWLANICRNREYSIPCPIARNSNHGPHYSTFVLKYTATMIVGISSALFMLCEKTFASYREVVEMCNFRI